MISLCLVVQAQDFERIMSMCNMLGDELNDFRKQLQVATTEPDHQQFLLLTLSAIKSCKSRKTGMVDGENICGENDDSDEASDPQYELFFESLNKYEKSYVLGGKIIDVSVSVNHEENSKFGNGRVDDAADQSPRLPNEQTPVNQHASDNIKDRRNEISRKKPDLRNKGIIRESEVGFSKALSKKTDDWGSCNVSKDMNVVQEDNIVTDNQSEPQGQARLRKADKGEDVDKAPVNLHASDNFDDRRSEISKNKPDLRNKGIFKKSEVGFSKALSKKMDTLGSCKVSKSMTVVEEDNIETYNQSEPHGQALLRKADKGKDVDKAPVDQHASDHEDNTETDNQNKSHGQSPFRKAGKGEDAHKAPVNRHASDHVEDRRNEISKMKPGLRSKGMIKESEVGFSKALSKKMDNLGSCKLSKNMTVVQEDDIVTDNQSEPHGQAWLRKAEKRENVDKAHYAADSESVIQIRYHENRYWIPDPRINSEPKNQSEPVGEAQPIKRQNGLKGKNVILREHKPDTEKHLYLKPDPKHNLATKYQTVHANQVVPSEEDKEAQIKTNLLKMKEKNVVTDDCVGNSKAVNYRDNEHLYPRPSLDKNLEEHQHEDADLTQPGKKHEVQRQGKLRKVVHGSHEIKVDDAASRNDVAQMENESLFHKPCPRKNQVTKTFIDQDHPKQSHSMLMKERDTMDDSDSDVEILDSASFYRAGNPGPFVTSKKFHKSVTEDDNIKLLGRTSPQFDFKIQVMNVLRKPYDKQESNRLREAFMAGSYVKFHPDLVKKLAIHRYEKGKCLSILRGFFFWLENLTKEGSFKPWKDRECLGVDPALL